MDEISGLPAHPLIVHAAVVLLPLAGAGIVITAAFAPLRRVLAPIVLALTIGALAATVMATQSGEALEERIDDDDDDVQELVDRHSELGEGVLPWAFASLVAASAVVLVGPLRRRAPRIDARTATVTLTLIGSVVAAGSVVSVVRAGHSGAEAVWTDNDHLEDEDEDDDEDEDEDDD